MYNLGLLFHEMVVKNKKFYFPVLIFVVIGCAMLFLCVSAFLSIFMPYKNILSGIFNPSYELEIKNISLTGEVLGLSSTTNISIGTSDEYAMLTKEDYKYLKERSENAFSYLAGNHVPVFLESADNNQSCALFYLSEQYISSNSRLSDIVNPYIIISKSNYEALVYSLSKPVVHQLLLSFPYTLDKNDGCFYTLNNEKVNVYFAEDIEGIGNTDLSGVKSGLSGTYCYEAKTDIVLPYKYLYDKYSTLADLFYYIRFSDINDADRLKDVLVHLNRSHENIYVYNLSSTVWQVFRFMRADLENFIILVAVSLSMFLIVILSFIGVQMILFERQKRAIAIHLAMGASPFSLAVRQLFKSVGITVVGAVLGTVAGNYILPMLNINVRAGGFLAGRIVTIAASLNAGIIVVIFALVLGCLAAVPSLISINKVKPKDLLRSE